MRLIIEARMEDEQTSSTATEAMAKCLLETSRSDMHRKVGNVALISSS